MTHYHLTIAELDERGIRSRRRVTVRSEADAAAEMEVEEESALMRGTQADLAGKPFARDAVMTSCQDPLCLGAFAPRTPRLTVPELVARGVRYDGRPSIYGAQNSQHLDEECEGA